MSLNSSNNNSEETILTLSKLSKQVKKSLDTSLPGQFWVIAEISEMHLNTSGHAYLDLVEKDAENDKILARMRATIWAYTYRMLRPYFEGTTGYQLSAGIKVLILVSLEYHPNYSISLNIKDIDPSYTLGDIARKKAEIIDRLKREGVMDMNKEIPLPLVPQRIAVISSETAAGYGDFINSLSSNNYGFHFHISLFPSVMQGEKSEESIIESLEKIYENESAFDAVVIIRGGGAQIELDCFNNYDLAYHITQFPLPVLTGIGHERDETVTDLVAHTKLKTPTAVAEFLIDGMAVFLEKLQLIEEQLTGFVTEKLTYERENISRMASKLALSTRESLFVAGKDLDNKIFKIRESVRSSLTKAGNLLKEKSIYLRYGLKEQLDGKKQKLGQDWIEVKKLTGMRIKNETEKLESLMKITDLYDPKNVLARGFSITMYKGKALKKADQISKDEEMTTILHKGKIISKVK